MTSTSWLMFPPVTSSWRMLVVRSGALFIEATLEHSEEDFGVGWCRYLRELNHDCAACPSELLCPAKRVDYQYPKLKGRCHATSCHHHRTVWQQRSNSHPWAHCAPEEHHAQAIVAIPGIPNEVTILVAPASPPLGLGQLVNEVRS